MADSSEGLQPGGHVIWAPKERGEEIRRDGAAVRSPRILRYGETKLSLSTPPDREKRGATAQSASPRKIGSAFLTPRTASDVLHGRRGPGSAGDSVPRRLTSFPKHKGFNFAASLDLGSEVPRASPAATTPPGSPPPFSPLPPQVGFAHVLESSGLKSTFTSSILFRFRGLLGGTQRRCPRPIQRHACTKCF